MRARLCLERRPALYRLITEPQPPLALQYKDKKLISAQDHAAQRAVYEKLKKQWQKEALDTDEKIGLTRTIL